MEARTLTELDARAYRSLRIEASKEEWWVGTPVLQRDLEALYEVERNVIGDHERLGTRIWGAFDDLTLAGVVALSPGRTGSMRFVWLWGLYVRPRYRGMSASQVLLEAALTAATTQFSAWRVFGACPRAATSIKPLLARLGFEPAIDAHALASQMISEGEEIIEYRRDLLANDQME